MKKKSTSQSAFFNLCVLIGLVVVLAGVFLALLGFGAFSNASAQVVKVSTPAVGSAAASASAAQWVWQNPLPQGNSLYGVSFVDASNGTAVGGYGTILRTTDGGQNWTIQSSGTTSTLYGVSFTDPSHGTAVGGDGTIIRTTDGGNNWVSQASGTTNALLAVSFIDANTGTAVGENGIILRTTNGGVSWESQTSGTTNNLNAVAFTDTKQWNSC